MTKKLNAVCVILAGGAGRRLGGIEKATLSIGGRRLVDQAIQTLRPQGMEVALSLQETRDWADELDVDVLFDRPAPGLGPAGGIAAALHWALKHPGRPDWVITTPVDTPFLPNDLAQRLTRKDARIVVARSANRAHYTVAAWRPSLSDAFEGALADGPLAVRTFQAHHSVAYVTWPVDLIDPFLNINTHADVQEAEQIMSTTGT